MILNEGINACNCNYGMDARKWMPWIVMKYGNERMGLQDVLNVWKWMYFIEALYVCTLKFDCEWGNGMGPQGLGMVPWESPSGILSPTVPWVQW